MEKQTGNQVHDSLKVMVVLLCDVINESKNMVSVGAAKPVFPPN